MQTKRSQGLAIQIGIRVPAEVALEIDGEITRLSASIGMEVPRAAIALALIKEALAARQRTAPQAKGAR